ncbi:MAG: chemotaxis protein MotB [Ignavibacteriales bacterium]|nr:MAG: chemotaxis protein MotB [Ignavibacteriales bacterium]
MSFRRETSDGSGNGRGFGLEEWGSSLLDKDPLSKRTSSKRTRRNGSNLNEDDSVFTEEHDKDRYLITYADLITLLLGLFILLYASSNIDVAKYQKMISAMGSYFGSSYNSQTNGKYISAGNSDEQNLISLKDKVNTLIRQNDIQKDVSIVETERGITVRILDDILFTSGSAELKGYSKIILNKIAGILKNLPNDIRIEGHTDNVPVNSNMFPSNWHLSVGRATNTAYYLMINEGLPQERVSIVGYSEYNPIASNLTPEGRANNRRVDIVILN